MIKRSEAGVVLMHRIADVLEGHARPQEFDRASGGYGLEVGIVAACLHPEWAQAVFLTLHATETDRQRAAVAIKALVDDLPIAVEQEEQT